jgi:hypothetical protein
MVGWLPTLAWCAQREGPCGPSRKRAAARAVRQRRRLAVATRKGFWAVLAGFVAAAWKLVAAAVVALFVGIGKLFKKKE